MPLVKFKNIGSIGVKTCSKCGCEKSLALFSKKASCRDGFDAQCKECVNIRVTAWRNANLERAMNNCRAWHERNRKRSREIGVERYEKKKDAIKAQHKSYRENNRDKVRAYTAKYRASLIAATTSWANEFFIDEAYQLAKLRSKVTGIQWEVDHIVPLQSKYVCGLHCESNLQVIPAVENKRKMNSWWPDMPEELPCH